VQNQEIVQEQTNGVSLTFQEYQAVYSEITKKSENIHKIYAKSFMLKKPDISHLKGLIDDILRQYNIVSINTNLTVFQSDNTQKTYSSIENFLAIETTSKATEQIIVEYDILIKAPNIEKKQNYKITIKMVSDIVAFEKMRDSIPLELIDMIEKNNIDVKIDYIDYTVAKSILNVIDEWIEDISYNNDKITLFFEKHKTLISLSVKNLIIIFSFILIYKYIPNYIAVNETNMQILGRFFIIAFALIYFSNKIAIFSSNVIKSNLAFLQDFSAIQLTEQDKKNIKKGKSKKTRRWFSVISTIILTIIYGVISSIIASKYFQD
jgi:hypothetical protein